MIKLGISPCFLYPDPDRPVFGPKTLAYLEGDMGRYLARPQVLPVLMPFLPKKQRADRVRLMDAWVFQGGTDLAPQSYGERPIEAERWPGDPFRDEYELELLDLALKAGKPVLGICRGLQLLNVYRGGSLYQDLTTQLPGARLHRDAELYDQLFHDVVFPANTLLARLHTKSPLHRVNSVHHQGIKQLGTGLDILAYSSEDQLVEAIQDRESPPGQVIAVQWHPEFFPHARQPVLDGECLLTHFLNQCATESTRES